MYVLPSFIENLPNSLAEAQVGESPLVVSCAGVIPSMVINGHSGILFPPADTAVLAMKIQLFFEDSNLAEYCSEQARKISHTRHNEEVVTASVLRVYDEIKNSTVV